MELILYSYFFATMLPSNKAPWGLIRDGRLFEKLSFQFGAFSRICGILSYTVTTTAAARYQSSFQSSLSLVALFSQPYFIINQQGFS